MAQGGGNIAVMAAAIVAAGGGNIVAQGGGNAVAHGLVQSNATGGAGGVATAAGNISNQSAIVGTTFGSLAAGTVPIQMPVDSVLQGGPSGLIQGAARAAAQFTSALIPNVPGSSDVSMFVSNNGQYLTLVTICETPGQQDIIVYKDPRVTLTPINGTPAPVTVSATPFTVTRGPVTRDAHTHQPYQILTVTNAGTSAVSGPVLVALTGLPAGVSVATPNNLLAGSPAVAATSGTLAPGASVKDPRGLPGSDQRPLLLRHRRLRGRAVNKGPQGPALQGRAGARRSLLKQAVGHSRSGGT